MEKCLLDEVVWVFFGLFLEWVRRVLVRVIVIYGKLEFDDVDLILEEKC